MQESLLSSRVNQYSTLLFSPFIEILLSKKASQHSSTELPAPSQWIFFLVLNRILFEATQHPLKLVPRDSNFKEIVYTSVQQQSLKTKGW